MPSNMKPSLPRRISPGPHEGELQAVQDIGAGYVDDRAAVPAFLRALDRGEPAVERGGPAPGFCRGRCCQGSQRDGRQDQCSGQHHRVPHPRCLKLHRPSQADRQRPFERTRGGFRSGGQEKIGIRFLCHTPKGMRRRADRYPRSFGGRVAGRGAIPRADIVETGARCCRLAASRPRAVSGQYPCGRLGRSGTPGSAGGGRTGCRLLRDAGLRVV